MYPTQQHFNKKEKIKKLPLFEEAKDLLKFLESNFTESLRQAIRILVKTMIKEEMEDFRKEVDEKIYFNGNYLRKMISSFGEIRDIPIPRFRQRADDLKLSSLDVFNQEEEKFFHLIEEMHLLGISQRKIKYLAEKCFGIKLSANRVGFVYKDLAEKEELNINSKPLDDDFEYLLLDGIWEKTKGYGWDDNKSVLLCALGLRPNGERKIVGFSLSREEDYENWHELLKKIKERGLAGKKLELIITDDCRGLKNALNSLFPKIPTQICIVHKMRNVFKKTSFTNRTPIAKDLTEIFASSNKKEALEKAKATVKKWYLIEPKAMESLRFNLEYCFTYFKFPKDKWKKIRTTNLLEREFRELRRRMKVFDNTFQNVESANRYANSLFNYLNDNYPLKQSLHTKS
jgi:transposase-like protein